MPNSLPFPIRVAAGLVSTGLDTLRGFPQNLPTIGVEIAGHVTKAGLQVRQQFVELALRGDELLQSHTEPEEHPAWAHFDDEEIYPPTTGADETPAGDIDDDPAADGTSNDVHEAAEDPEVHDPDDAQTDDVDAAVDSVGVDDHGPDESAAALPGTAADGDALLPGYDSMTITQVRGHLRLLSIEQVRQLLEHEKAGGNRPAMVTLLGNRIVTLQHR
jgi:hypothetical protein